MKLSSRLPACGSGAGHECLVFLGLTWRHLVERFQPWLPFGSEPSILCFGGHSCSLVLLARLGVGPVAGRRSTASAGMRCSSPQLQTAVLGCHQCRPSPE